MKLIIGNKYKWKHENKTSIFVGKCGNWTQFVLLSTDEIWCEVLDSDLCFMEEVE